MFQFRTNRLARGRVPQLGALLLVGRDEAAAGGIEGDKRGRVGGGKRQRVPYLPIREVPDAHQTVLAAGRQQKAVLAESDMKLRRRVGKLKRRSPVGGVP